MELSYNRLWKILIDKNIDKTKLCEKAEISTNDMAKLGINKPVQLETLIKICRVLECKIDDIMEYNINDKSTVLKVFEAFSGVGAQHMALRNINKEYEIVATSDIDEFAILSYYYVHRKNKRLIKSVSSDKMINYLVEKGIGSKQHFKKKDSEKLIEIYNASIKENNLGDISRLNSEEIPDHNLFTYSFPCQDISSVGTRKGLDKDSGTRSSLLWECKKVIENKKPKYLILENVKNLTIGKNRKNFEAWLEYLESQGYDNYWKIFDAQNYGIPQRRPRVIVVSKLGKSKTDLVKDNIGTKKNIKDIIDKNETKWSIFKPKAEIKGSIKEGECLFLDDRDWKMNGVMISKVCSTQRAGRTGLKWIKKQNDKLYERKLNALECCRLMGYDDKDYLNMKNGGISDSIIMKICGNSIVVNVLENVFRNIYEEETND